MTFQTPGLIQLSSNLSKDIRKYTILSTDEQVAETLIQKTDALARIVSEGLQFCDSTEQYEYKINAQCLLLLKLYRHATLEGQVREVRCSELCAQLFRILNVMKNSNQRGW
jgi:hypothetical protein